MAEYGGYTNLLRFVFGGRDDFFPVREEDVSFIDGILRELPDPRMAEVLSKQFGLGEWSDRKIKSHREIGKSMSPQLSRESVRRLRQAAKRRLAHHQNNLRKMHKEGLEKILKITERRLAAARQTIEQLTTPPDPKKIDFADARAIPIGQAGLSVRAQNALRNNGLETLGDVAGLTDWGLRRIHNLGEKTVAEIIAKLQEYGLQLSVPDS